MLPNIVILPCFGWLCYCYISHSKAILSMKQLFDQLILSYTHRHISRHQPGAFSDRYSNNKSHFHQVEVGKKCATRPSLHMVKISNVALPPNTQQRL